MPTGPLTSLRCATPRKFPARVLDFVTRHAELPSLEVVERRRADDGFVKYLFESPLGGRVEAVRIPLFDTKYVVCVSSQVGCALACDFCATGRMGFQRNLQTWEILEQVRHDPRRGRTAASRAWSSWGWASRCSTTRGPPRGADPLPPGRVRHLRPGHHLLHRGLGAGHSPLRPRGPSLPARVQRDLRHSREARPGDAGGADPSVARAGGGDPRVHASSGSERAMVAYVCIRGFNMGREDAEALRDAFEGIPIKLDLIDVTDPTGRYQPPTPRSSRGFATTCRSSEPRSPGATRAARTSARPAGRSRPRPTVERMVSTLRVKPRPRAIFLASSFQAGWQSPPPDSFLLRQSHETQPAGGPFPWRSPRGLPDPSPGETSDRPHRKSLERTTPAITREAPWFAFNASAAPAAPGRSDLRTQRASCSGPTSRGSIFGLDVGASLSRTEGGLHAHPEDAALLRQVFERLRERRRGIRPLLRARRRAGRGALRRGRRARRPRRLGVPRPGGGAGGGARLGYLAGAGGARCGLAGADRARRMGRWWVGTPTRCASRRSAPRCWSGSSVRC